MLLNLAELFHQSSEVKSRPAAIRAASRVRATLQSVDVLLDGFEQLDAQCLFLRVPPASSSAEINLRLAGQYALSTISAGGWLLTPSPETGEAGPYYWMPVIPHLRKLDGEGRITEERIATFLNLDVCRDQLTVTFQAIPGFTLDFVVWRIGQPDLAVELMHLGTFEQQDIFLWGSHKVYRRPADIYRCLHHGWGYDARFLWPHKRMAYSENELHALFVTMQGLEHATSKSIYWLLKKQLLLSLLERQDSDGGWRHGFWTADLECHYRLHCSAMHMLMDALSEQKDPAIEQALRKAAEFIAAQASHIRGKTWFLHDSLEQNNASMAGYPQTWYPCRALGKSPTNTLVLNTHIDTIIALNRYQTLTGTNSLDQTLADARALLMEILSRAPADWLYRPLFRLFSLTLLPTPRAQALPLPTRALKRLARDHLTGFLGRIKCLQPRLVMPGGYIDRALTIGGLADTYLSINLMDLIRYRQFFPGEPRVDEVIAGAISFAVHNDLLEHWAEKKPKSYGVGFWIESMYRLCIQRRAPEDYARLAQALVLAQREGLGAPPSVFGNNREAVPSPSQIPCLRPMNPRIRIVNLSLGATSEFLLINTAKQPADIGWETTPAQSFSWHEGSDVEPLGDQPRELGGGCWVLLRSRVGDTGR